MKTRTILCFGMIFTLTSAYTGWASANRQPNALSDAEYYKKLKALEEKLEHQVAHPDADYPANLKVDDKAGLDSLLEMTRHFPQTPRDTVKSMQALVAANANEILPRLADYTQKKGVDVAALLDSYQLLAANGYGGYGSPATKSFTQWVKNEAQGESTLIEAGVAVRIADLMRPGAYATVQFNKRFLEIKDSISKPMREIQGSTKWEDLTQEQSTKIAPLVQQELREATQLMKGLDEWLQNPNYG